MVIIMCLTVGACSRPKIVLTPLNNQTESQFQADKDYCNKKAMEAVLDEDIDRFFDGAEVWRKVFEGCMKIKGYERES
jgi:hypothetical protein